LGTAGIAVGDEVFGLTDGFRDRAAAEYVAVAARNLAPKPRTVDYVHAAAVPRAGLTAWQGLFDHGGLAKGQTEIFFIQEASRAQLTELARLVDEGHLRPQVGAVYPLAEAAKAYSAKAAGGIPGRVVLQP
jgi:NADPH:quinone reductase-like Zn-dependent oxidoreductase